MDYNDWLDEVDAECRSQLGQELDELQLSGRLLKSHWRAGDSPQEFVSEMNERTLADIEEEPIDLRYEL